MKDDYKGIVKLNQENDRKRANDLTILNESAKKELAEMTDYTNYHPNPITKPFMRKYILSKLEYPTAESELAQSMTELNGRVQNLYLDAYTHRKTELEMQELQIELDTLEGKLSDDEAKLAKKTVSIAKTKLEIAHKEVALNKITLTANARFEEARNWRACVEDIKKELGVSNLDEVDFTRVRMDLMKGKIQKWGELYAEGSLEMTPSKLQAIDSEKDSFEKGIQIGLDRLSETMTHDAFLQHCKKLGIRVQESSKHKQ